jgi:hypothetical protein
MFIPMTVSQFKEAYSDDLVYYDRSFQRRFGAWNRAQENCFLVNLFRGKAHTIVVVADVRQCLTYSQKIGQVNSSNAFRHILDSGCSSISLDGQHRTKTIQKYFRNDITLTGTFTDVLGKEHKLENVYYKDTPETLQSQFLNSQIVISTEANSLYEELSQQFRDLNSGAPTNDQEARNSYASPIAKTIRQWRDRWQTPLSRVVKACDVIRMGDDELLVKFAMHLMRKYNNCNFEISGDLKSSQLDQFYKIGLGASKIGSKTSPYVPSEIYRIQDILAIAMHAFEKQTAYPRSKLIAAKTAWAIVLAAEWAYDNDFVVTDYEKFFNAVKKSDEHLIIEGESEYFAAKQKKISNMEDPSNVAKTPYYHSWTGVPHQKHARSNRKKKLNKHLNEAFVSTNKLGDLGLEEKRDLAA